MPNKTYHIHIGAHDIYPTLLETVSNEFSAEFREAGIYVVPATEFQSQIRPMLTMGSTNGPRHVSKFGFSDHGHHVVMSAHGILCNKNAVLNRRGLYTDIDKFLANLKIFFAGEDLTIHFLTPPQHDYALIADAITRTDWPISWLPAIMQISNLFRDVGFTIWPVEKRGDDAVEFCETVLDFKMKPSEQETVRRIGMEQRFPITRFPKAHIGDPQHTMLSAYMDRIFLEDMLQIFDSRSVEIGLKRMRDELSLS